MKKYMVAVLMVIATIASVKAQYGNQDYAYNDDRYYYDNDFDWHWDIRVKISNGIQRGLLTQNESNRLYGILEDVERKEYAYQADGLFSGWEQQEIWDDVIYLNQRLGIELNDYDRNFYGFDVYGYDRRGYNRWFYQGGYDFFRFDKRGFGSIRLGYVPRPNYNGWYRNNNNHIARRYYTERPHYDNRGNNRGFASRNHDNRDFGNSRGNSDYNRNRTNGNDNSRNNSQGNYGNNRNDRLEMPNNRPNNNGNGFPSGGGRPERVEPNNNGNGFPNGGGRPERVEVPNTRPQRIDIPEGNSGGRPERTEPNNRSDNANRGGGNSRIEAPQSGGNGGGHRGPR
jgi:hypothetical protein